MNIPELLLNDLVNLPCCRIDIRTDNSFSIGLGRKYEKKSKLSRIKYYGEWEFGTYCAPWRIIKGEEVVFGSQGFSSDNSHYIEFMTGFINSNLVDIKHLSDYDIRFVFSNEYMIDFFNCSSDNDEIIHVLHINGKYWEFDNNGKWRFGIAALPAMENNDL